MSSNSYFVIVGNKDQPLYEAEFGPSTRQDRKEESRHLNQFIAHSALDCIDEIMWGSTQMYLKVIDKFNEWFVSGFLTPSGIRFVLLHDTPNSDGIRNYFGEVHELYVKLLLNPFTETNAPISSGSFDQKVRSLARKYL